MHSNNPVRRGVLTLIVVLSFVLPVRLAGQAGAGNLEGRVTDPSGAAVPNATVVLTAADGQVRVLTSAGDGRYTAAGLAPGRYTIRVNAPGFALFENPALDIAAGARQTLDVRLVLNTTKQEITVSDTPAVDVDPSSNVGAIVLKGSDLEALSDDPDDLQADLQALAGPSAGPNGGQIYIDGFTGGQLPPKSSIREIRINQNPFSAEYDRLGFGRIEIFTKPGTDRLRGQAFFNFGDSALNARNPFAPDKPSSQMKMFDFNLGGPLTKRSSFFVSAERRASDETSVVSALTLDPSLVVTPFSDSVLSPLTRTSINPRIDYQLSPGNTLVARYSYGTNRRDNEGVGEFALPSRAYDSSSTDHTVRLTETAVLNAHIINESRFQYTRERDNQSALNMDPGISVLGAFTGGGAGVGRSYTNQDRYEFYNSTSMTRGAHLLRFGGRVRGVTYTGYSMQGYNGTFTFTSLDAYRITLAGLADGLTGEEIRAAGGGASQFSMSAGNPLAGVRQADVGVFAQDDWRMRPNFTLSLGLRYEAQNNIGDHGDFAPRVGFAWGIGRRGSTPKTVVRGGFGLFYDRVSEGLTLQAIRLNGINQQQFVVPFPDFYPLIPTAASLEANLVRSAIRELDPTLRSPYIAQSVISVERQLPKSISAAVTYAYSRGLHVLRSRNVNAPLPGAWNPLDPSSAVRPYGDAGDIYVFESDGMFKQRQLITNISARISPRFMLFGFYVLGKAEGNADGAQDFPANQYDVSGEWGRSAFDVRHRGMIGGSLTLPFGLRVNPFITASSGRPFDITVGRDLNGDSLFNDRPAFASAAGPYVVSTAYGMFDLNPSPGMVIIPRNYGEGPGEFAINLRVSRTFGFGGERGGSTGMPGEGRPMGPPPGAGMGGRGGGGMRGGGGGMRGGGDHGPGGMFGESSGRRYSLTLSASARNLFNTVNLAAPIGNLSSPLFGQSNAIAGGFGGSASANRRVELQARFSF